MKTIKSVLDYKINKDKLHIITGGDGPTGINSDGKATDGWIDSNGDGHFGEGDMICFMEPYDVN